LESGVVERTCPSVGRSLLEPGAETEGGEGVDDGVAIGPRDDSCCLYHGTLACANVAHKSAPRKEPLMECMVSVMHSV